MISRFFTHTQLLTHTSRSVCVEQLCPNGSHPPPLRTAMWPEQLIAWLAPGPQLCRRSSRSWQMPPMQRALFITSMSPMHNATLRPPPEHCEAKVQDCANRVVPLCAIRNSRPSINVSRPAQPSGHIPARRAGVRSGSGNGGERGVRERDIAHPGLRKICRVLYMPASLKPRWATRAAPASLPLS